MKNFFKIFVLIFFTYPIFAIANFAQFSDSLGNVDINIINPSPYPFDTIDVTSSDISIINNDQVTVSTSGIYKVSYSLNWSTTNNSRRQIQTYVIKNSQDTISGSISYGYARRVDQAASATNNTTFLVDLQENDSLQLIYNRDSTVGGTTLSIPGESSITIHRIGDSIAHPTLYASCRDILLQDPASLSDTYTIDPDNSGPIQPLDVYCDMEFDGGGWTLVGSFNNPQATAVNTSVFLNSNTYLTDAIFQTLLNQAVERVRFSFDKEIGIQKSNIGGHSCHNLNDTDGLAGFNGFTSNVLSWSHNELSDCNGSGSDYTLMVINSDSNSVVAAAQGGNYLEIQNGSAWTPLVQGGVIIETGILLSQDLYIYVR